MHSKRGLWAWGSCGQPTGGAATHLVGYSSVLDFLWLVLSRKWRQKLGKLAGIGQVLAVWGWLSSVGISSGCVCVCVCVCAFSVVSDSLRPSRLWRSHRDPEGTFENPPQARPPAAHPIPTASE